MTLVACYVGFLMGTTKIKLPSKLDSKLTIQNLKISFGPSLKKQAGLDHPKSIPNCILN